MKTKLIVTCEHASNRIPADCPELLEHPLKDFDQHRLYDWGAKEVARKFAELTKAPLWEGKTTRLAIDLNRSIGNPELFYGAASNFSESKKAELIAKHYLPFRKEVEDTIGEWIEEGNNVLHISIHSFTPILNNLKRLAELGVLFDESKDFETKIAKGIMEYHRNQYEHLAVMANTPYHGTDDGHTASLRKVFPEQYAGIEIEYSQILDLERQPERWANDLLDSIQFALDRK